MVRPLILVAASGLAREVAEVVAVLDEYELVGCLDDSPALWSTRVGSLDVLGGLDLITEHPTAHVVVCAGKGSARRAIVERLHGLAVTDDRFATVVHPSVHFPPSCRIGAGSILLAHVAVTADVSVGNHVVVMPNCTLTHDDVLEDYATLAAGVGLAGGVRVGEGAYLGMNASVREQLSVGPRSLLGMGAAAIEDVPANQVWAGVPARLLERQPMKASA